MLAFTEIQLCVARLRGSVPVLTSRHCPSMKIYSSPSRMLTYVLSTFCVMVLKSTETTVIKAPEHAMPLDDALRLGG